jgi:hypothetical protein
MAVLAMETFAQMAAAA